MNAVRSLLAAVAVGALTVSAQAGDVRIMWYSDGVEGEVMQDLVNRFMQDNPGINVILDNVAYQVIQEQLPVQLEAGQGPDIARVTNLKALADHWLDITPYVADPEYWRENFGANADWMRPDGSDAITGFMTQLTLTGGFANKTLFDQAGVEIPGPKATWQEWVDAATKVAENQQVPMAVSIDRSGHRISGPNISYGAKYIGPDGLPLPVDDGVKGFVTDFVNWNNSGAVNKEVWVSASGSTYRAAAPDFINGQLVYYYSGNWQIPNFDSKIGNAFDWVATGSPCGPDSCTGIPGGAALVAIKYTQNPEEVGKVMDYFAREDIVKEFSERTLFLPAHKGVIATGGLDFKTDNPLVKEALKTFVEASSSTAPEALALPGWKWASAYYNALVARTSQAIAGELTLDQAFAAMDEDIAKAVAEGTR